jgi:hypothetical protein
VNIVLWSSQAPEQFALELEQDGAAATVLKLTVGGATAEVRLDRVPAIPAVLVVPADAGQRLMTLAEVRQLAAAAFDQAAQALEAQWHAAVAAVSSASLHADMATRFAGFTPFPGGGAATAFQGAVKLNLNACLVDAAVRLEAALAIAADCQLTFGGTLLTARVAWTLSMRADGTVPRLSVHLPGPGLRFPDFDFPAFDPAALALPGIPDFDLALPSLPGIPLSISHNGVTAASVSYTPGTGALQFGVTVKDAVLTVFDESCNLGSPALRFDNGAITIDGLAAGPFMLEWAPRDAAPLPAPVDGVSLKLDAGSLQFALEIDANVALLKGVLAQTLTLFPSLQPEKKLTLHVVLPFLNDDLADAVTIGGVTIARKVAIVLDGIEHVAGALLQHVAWSGSISWNLTLPALGPAHIDTLIDILSAILGAIVNGLAGLARIIEAGLRAVFGLLRKGAAALRGLDLRLVLDARSGAIGQVLLGLHNSPGGVVNIVDVSALSLTAPADVDLALLIDLRDGERDAYLVATTATGDKPLLSMGSDLWFGSAGQDLSAGDVSGPGTTGNSKVAQKMIAIEVRARADASAQRFSFIPFGIRHGEAVFFYALETPLPAFDTVPTVAFAGYRLRDDLARSLDAVVKFDLGSARERFLPFLAAPADDKTGGSLGDMLKQYMQITDVATENIHLVDGTFDCAVDVTIKAMGSAIASQVRIELDARRMTARLRAGAMHISLPEGKPFELLGMHVSFVEKKPSVPPLKGNQFVLDLASGDPRLYLNDTYKMVLEFDRLGSGSPLRFEVARFVLHGGGMDLEASLAAPHTMRLNGLETDFTFKEARIVVRGGRIEAFSLAAVGKLPPALLGNVDVGLQVDFGQRANGSIGLLNGAIELKNKGKPIRSEQMHFELTLDALSVRVFEDGDGLYFCAFISGAAKFKPEAPALADGMLKKLAGVDIKFTDCPVCGPSDVIARELEKLDLSFVVALDKPVKATLFELFTIEVRSFGLEPKCRAFDDRPAAIVIGGQITFAASGDVVRAECDFHKLYLAPPLPTQFLPRLKCEGLGLSLKLGSALEIEGKVVAVDGRMPDNVLVSKAPANSIKGQGFMGQGRIAIQGLPPFAASFGFVEIEVPVAGHAGLFESKRAWFVFLEAQHLSYHFQLGPVPLFVREAGLGLGCHFTYVGIQAIDEATNLAAMIAAVGTIAATALEPAKFPSWTVSPQGDLTLVGRLFISMSSASAPSEPLVWRPGEEENLPNVMLLNVVAAMRKTTFLMTANVWLGYNYSDWDKGRHVGANSLVGKQAMTGYVLLAGARSEFLARVKSNPGAEVGPRLAMPQQFKDALKEIEFDATVYIRPGLLHIELGWPNRIRWSKNFAGVNVSVAGGAIFRVHEGTMLAGLNLEGNLNFSMSARLDAGCVGVAVSASVYAALVARIIGYLDALDVANSLYYSLFSLQVQVTFAVSAWLEIDAWLCKITIRISFAMSLQIDVLSELALQGDVQMGARVRATIAVSIFGRSLGLSVGLAINPGLVDNAAARVGRFMNLGLIQDVPLVTPDLATQDAANEAAAVRGGQRYAARAAASTANLPDSGIAHVPHEDPVAARMVKPPTPAVPIAPTDFQVVLTYPQVLPPTAGIPQEDIDQWVYLTFLPIDAHPASETGAAQRGSFYAAPLPSDANPTPPDHTIVFPAAAAGAQFYAFQDDAWTLQTLAAVDPVWPTHVRWTAALDFTESTEGSADHTPVEASGKATMAHLFFAAFRTNAANLDAVTTTANAYEEPLARPPIDVESASIGRLAAPTQQQYARQERGYNLNMAQDPADRRCHEARDFLLQKFSSDLFQLASNGVVPAEAHVVHVGLTLLVPLASLPGDCAMIRKREGGASRPCKVFNPPTLRFSVKPPRFDQVACQFRENRAWLDWDLRWDHGTDPEYFVQHYELTRWIEIDDVPVGEGTRRTFKRADQVAEDANGKRRVVQRSAWQYIDEFEDMSAIDKARLFDPVTNAIVRYTVVPVCVSGARGRPCSDFFAARTGIPQLGAIKKASAILVIDPIPDGPGRDVVKEPQLRLLIEQGNDALRADDKLQWRLLLRGVAITPSGQYGSDGHTEQALSGAIGAVHMAQPGDIECVLPPGWNQHAKGNPVDDQHAPINTFAPELIAALRQNAVPLAHTLLVQSFVTRRVETAPNQFEDKVVARSALVMVELSIDILAAQADGRGLKLRVEALEMVRAPLRQEEYLLDPVAWVDLHAAPGRAAVRDPVAAPTVTDLQSNSVVHPDFGGVTRLGWNVRPHGLGAAALPPYRLLAGFDVVSMDLDSGDQAGVAADWLSDRVRYLRSASLISPSNARLTPAEVGEPGNWKARYPSQGARRRAGGAWYSPAESRIDWPRSDLRREPLPQPASELINALLREGVPDYIELAMTGGAGIAWSFSLTAAPDSLWVLDATGTRLTYRGGSARDEKAAASLRKCLRQLSAIPVAGTTMVAGFTRESKRNWSLNLHACLRPDAVSTVTLLRESVPMLFDRELHPLLEAIMARMRLLPTGGGTERLLDLDRRPPPVVPAKTVDAFINELTDAVDPYGWAILDRLGLGVTLRLFDPVEDRFLAPDELHGQLAMALRDPALRELYSESFPQLFVDVLLQPGGMLVPAAFSSVADRDGVIGHNDGATLHQDHGLSMLRLSVRPSIVQHVGYYVSDRLAQDTPDGPALAGVDYFLPAKNEGGNFPADTKLKVFLQQLEEAGIGADAGRTRQKQLVILRGMNLVPGLPGDTAPGGAVDAFGHFDSWPQWDYKNEDHLSHRSTLAFRTLLRNALDLEDDLTASDILAVGQRWEDFNARFFHYAAEPGAGTGTPFAFAAVEPAGPMQVAADSAGEIGVTLPEADGYAHMRAFAVLPQWRYARLLRDAGHADVDTLLLEKRGQIAIAPPGGQPNYVISTIERTATVQAPEVLAVARLGDRVWWAKAGELREEPPSSGMPSLRDDGFVRIGLDPGHALPVVASHHPELRPSKRNVTPARGLALAGALTTFVLMPSDMAWCQRFLPPDVLEPLHRDGQAWPPSVDADLLDQVTRLLGAPPVDSKLRVLRYLPHWYRHVISLSAGAGNAVAETVSAYLAEAPARLMEVDGGKLVLKPGHPWQAMLDHGIAPAPVLPADATTTPARFQVDIPALRYGDTTDAVTAGLWPGDIANLADPGVSYDVEFEAAAQPLRPRKTVTPVARIARAPQAPGPGADLATFMLSSDWQATGTLNAHGATPHLAIVVTPMSMPVTVSEALSALLGAAPGLRNGVLRVPGGWSADWIEHFVAELAGPDMRGAALLWTALADAQVGMPAADVEGLALFPEYGLATFNLVKPATPEAWAALASVLADWAAALARHGSGLAKLLHDHYAPLAAMVAAATWPAYDPAAMPVPWLSTLPAPADGFGWLLPASARMLVPELMDDQAFLAVHARIVAAGKNALAARFVQLRARQRERALGGGQMRIRATRGDAIALALPLVSLT